MLRPLRMQVQEQLLLVPARRKPALRRTDSPHALLATDVPQLASEEDVMAFIRSLEAAGWRVQQENGWLLLDHDVPLPPVQPAEAYPGEWGCCVRLLQMHPGDDAPREMIRTLVKAADVGCERVEWLCRQWHGEFAAALRMHRPLPGGLLPYLMAAMKEESL